MSSMQRRRGLPARIFKTTTVTNNRGIKIQVAGEDYIDVTAYFVPERGSKAEVPGQQVINVVRMLVRPDLPDVDLWSHVEALGKKWDLVTPPSYHHGTRHTRHWAVDLRERP